MKCQLNSILHTDEYIYIYIYIYFFFVLQPIPGVILENDLGEKVSVSWLTSPCLELREK